MLAAPAAAEYDVALGLLAMLRQGLLLLLVHLAARHRVGTEVRRAKRHQATLAAPNVWK